VEHKPGSKIAHADALNRHVSTVSHKSSLDKVIIPQEQMNDALCVGQTPGSYSSKSEFFLDEQFVLYRRQNNSKHQLVIPKALIQDVIRKNHDPVYATHPGLKRTYNLIALNFWWPNMRKSIEDYIRNCDPCQRRKRSRKQLVHINRLKKSYNPSSWKPKTKRDPVKSQSKTPPLRATEEEDSEIQILSR
jgi:hypothetical protein